MCAAAAAAALVVMLLFSLETQNTPFQLRSAPAYFCLGCPRHYAAAAIEETWPRQGASVHTYGGHGAPRYPMYGFRDTSRPSRHIASLRPHLLPHLHPHPSIASLNVRTLVTHASLLCLSRTHRGLVCSPFAAVCVFVLCFPGSSSGFYRFGHEPIDIFIRLERFELS